MSKIKCRELSKQELQNLKQTELDMLKDIHKVCEKKGIKYSLYAGTLLGAVRHKGFIPWDDDIDIMMPREDYEKFIKEAEELLDEKYEIVTYKKNEGYGFLFAKVMKKNTKMVETSARKTNAPKGVFIDIFPIDKAPKDEKKRRKIFDRIKKENSKLLCRSNYIWDNGPLYDFLYRVRGSILRLIPQHKYVNIIENEIIKSNAATDYCMVCYETNLSLEKISFDADWFGEYIDLDFEQNTFKVIREHRKLLEHLYGDYMQLPPEECRAPHHTVVEFEIC